MREIDEARDIARAAEAEDPLDARLLRGRANALEHLGCRHDAARPGIAQLLVHFTLGKQRVHSDDDATRAPDCVRDDPVLRHVEAADRDRLARFEARLQQRSRDRIDVADELPVRHARARLALDQGSRIRPLTPASQREGREVNVGNGEFGQRAPQNHAVLCAAMSGRPFLQIPGPTNIPDRVLRAMDRQVVDHRGPEFAALTDSVRAGLRQVFGTRDGVTILYAASGTGAIEATLVNTLAPGDRVLVFSYGVFSASLARMARKFGFEVDEIELRWGQAIPHAELAARLEADTSSNRYKALLVVHNETSTGVTVDIAAIRAAMDAAGHDALLMVDTVSSLASIDFRMDDWRVDVAMCGSQKGLMLPPGLGIVCASPRAVAIAEHGGSPRHFWDWAPIMRENRIGLFPYTPATSMLFGLREALALLLEEGLPEVYARHQRLADGVRAAVQAWGLPMVAEEPATYSNTITAVRVPESVDSDVLTRHARERYNLSLGGGIGLLAGSAFRIGHLGALNELEVLATIGGTELTFADLGMDVELGSGLLACQSVFAGRAVASRDGLQVAMNV